MAQTHKNEEQLATAPIGRLMLKLAVPTVAAQLINMLYNIVDRIYIGHIPEVGSTALTGVGVTFPIITLVSAFAAFAGQGGAPLASGDAVYDADALYWLSRIISAESRGEPLEGQIAVGNVVLNRVDSPDFPDTIYGVIFDDRWGGQFTPVRNGTIYQEPTEQSIQAAKLCLEGVNVAKDSLYFLAPALTNNHWIMENRTHVMTIGAHWFYR